MATYVWTTDDRSLLFRAKDHDDAYRKVIAYRISFDLDGTLEERVQRAQEWFAKNDALVGPIDTNADLSRIQPFDGELPELEPYDDSEIEN